ncbi:hypothetical protein KC19_5G162700 [Ceratodon purpureus]|uniref:AB hydrolase-1 domain-containing protein n=1 Tax=Ceratodon purpureus TaxID=3225 RepID=A0A8T0I3L0_CERPU|nr:hypothetical protein KC19_5G162700 [Ceratodon purpureus]
MQKRSKFIRNKGEEKKVGREDLLSDKKLRLTDIVWTAREAIWWVLVRVFKVLQIIKAAVQALFQIILPEKFVARVESAIRDTREGLVTAAIRSWPATWAVRVIMDRFGTRGVRMAWYDPEKADEDVLQGYSKPLQCKDWERALLEFALAMAVNPAADMKSKESLGTKAIPFCCAVLVVTGNTHHLVPAWNARRLAVALPNTKFELVKRCGHLPQEETPDELLSIIERFLAKTFPSDSTSKPLHVPT